MGLITAEASENPESQPLLPWWSFSKTILAAAALSFVERRKLDLDAPIAGAPYTLRHLLQHTSGLPDYGPDPEYHRAVAAGESPWTIDELLRRVNATTLLFAPGTRFSYSNIGYLFVRQIIERAADADLDDALRMLVFDPLGIEGAFVASAPEELDAIIWGNARRYDPRWVYHGCVVGSLSWAATCLHRLMHGGLLAPATKSAMIVARSYDADADAPEDFGYGLGLMIEPARPGERLVGHAGSGPGSTITVFSALMGRRTFAAAVSTDAPDTFPKLIEYLRTLARVSP
ncbi:MAG: serine hydrolase [Acidobacteria bacterium]|nr:MAG: serine hydrolase [Acidobacteriota bacterium]PYR13548.1 MAG: serine hydrolase [Acidobacteriota bacterium]